MGPTNDGRWDLPRSNVSSLNRNPIVALLFHHVHDVIALDHNHTRHLADIIARISAPPHPGKSIEHNIPILTWNKSKISLALRHQAFVPGDKIDIFRKIRDANFSCIKIPSCPNYTPTYRTFSPLLALTDKEIIPDGSVIQQLINYCTALEPYEPKIATYTVTATLLQCIKSMEDIRYDKALHIVYMIGCPTAHLENDTSSLDTTLTCQNCDRQVTTLWEITPKPFITHPTKNYKERTLIISSTTKKLISAELKAQQLTNSSFPTPSENILTSFHESLPTYTCYLCAIPTIIETCTNNSRNPKKKYNYILKDLRMIANQGNPTLPFTHTTPPTQHPWGSIKHRTLIYKNVQNEPNVGTIGSILAYAPSSNPPNTSLVYYVHFPPLEPTTDDPQSPPEPPNPLDL